MKPNVRKPLVFFGRFFALLLMFSLLWYWLSLFYAGLLVGIGNSTMSALGYPPMLSLHDREITLAVFAQHVRVSTEISSFYGVPLVLALVWAAPQLSNQRRRRLSAWGVGTLALLHWLNLFSQAGMLLAPHWLGKLVAERLFLLSALGDMLVPAILCVNLTLRGQLRLTPREAHP